MPYIDNSRAKKNYIPLYSTFLVLVALIPFYALCFYVEPNSDDYYNAWRTLTYGYFRVQYNLYTQWTGRFFSSLLLTITNPMTFGWFQGVRWAAGLLLLALPLSLYAGIRILFEVHVSRSQTALASLTGLLLYLLLIPDVYSAFYWYTAAMVYTAGQVSFMLVFVAAASGLRGQRKHRNVWAVVAGAAAVATAGCNEVQLLLLSAALVSLLFLSWLQADVVAQRWWTSLLIVTVVAGIIAIVAPGNFTRLADKSSIPEPLSHKILVALPRTIRSLAFLLLNVRTLSAVVILYIFLSPLANQLRSTHSFFARQRVSLSLSVPLLLASLTVAQMFMCITLGSGLPRVDNLLLHFMLLGWAAVILAGAGPLVSTSRWKALDQQGRWIQVLAWVGIVVLCVTGSPRRAWQEWLYNAEPYQQQMQQRYALLQAAARNRQRQVTLPPITHVRHPHMLLASQDLKAEPEFWVNKETAAYYGLDSLTIDKNLLPKTHRDFGGSWLTPEEQRD